MKNNITVTVNGKPVLTCTPKYLIWAVSHCHYISVEPGELIEVSTENEFGKTIISEIMPEQEDEK